MRSSMPANIKEMKKELLDNYRGRVEHDQALRDKKIKEDASTIRGNIGNAYVAQSNAQDASDKMVGNFFKKVKTKLFGGEP